MPAVERTTSGQIIPKEKKEYNQRLFAKGWRKYLHESRFLWLRSKMKQLGLADVSIIELGCFDAKTINYLPFGFSRYEGYDANWEHGLELGRKRWKNEPGVTLIECQHPSDFNPSGKFDCAIAMETLEHLKSEALETYISKLAAATGQYLFVSVPYEKGLPLLVKYLYKSVRFKVDEPYTFRELIHAMKGNLSKVTRVEGGHKGFDHKELIILLSRYFDIKEVCGLPFALLPLSLNFSVGIVAKPKR